MTVFAAAFRAPVYSLQLLICPLPQSDGALGGRIPISITPSLKANSFSKLYQRSGRTHSVPLIIPTTPSSASGPSVGGADDIERFMTPRAGIRATMASFGIAPVPSCPGLPTSTRCTVSRHRFAGDARYPTDGG